MRKKKKTVRHDYAKKKIVILIFKQLLKFKLSNFLWTDMEV